MGRGGDPSSLDRCAGVDVSRAGAGTEWKTSPVRKKKGGYAGSDRAHGRPNDCLSRYSRLDRQPSTKFRPIQPTHNIPGLRGSVRSARAAGIIAWATNGGFLDVHHRRACVAGPGVHADAVRASPAGLSRLPGRAVSLTHAGGAPAVRHIPQRHRWVPEPGRAISSDAAICLRRRRPVSRRFSCGAPGSPAQMATPSGSRRRSPEAGVWFTLTRSSKAPASPGSPTSRTCSWARPSTATRWTRCRIWSRDIRAADRKMPPTRHPAAAESRG